MLARKMNPLLSTLSEKREHALENCLSSVLPPVETQALGGDCYLPLGHHLAFFNPLVPEDELLPDGTDDIHSPGPPFERRLWAGGRLEIDVAKYFTGASSWRLDSPFVCLERIKDVQLRGQDDAEKIFITIQRRFASLESLEKYGSQAVGTNRFIREAAMLDAFSNEASTTDDWGNASMIEERDIVFLKDSTVAELDAFKAGEFPPVKYLKCSFRPMLTSEIAANTIVALGQPDFSHTLIPTLSLLAQYSALTSNAHAIHLDTDYVRNVEGHRNLLVHGPLALTLILRLVNNHLRAQSGRAQTIRAIEYRNVAPLYCDEELRLCGRRREHLDEDGHPVYDIWIEGPTGGTAVKGTVRTSAASTKSDGFQPSAETQASNQPSNSSESNPHDNKPSHHDLDWSPDKGLQTLVSKLENSKPSLTRKQKRRIRARKLAIPIIRSIRAPPDPIEQVDPRVQRDPAVQLPTTPKLVPTTLVNHSSAPKEVENRDAVPAAASRNLQSAPRKISYVDRPLPIRYYGTDREHNAWKKEARERERAERVPFAVHGARKVRVLVIRPTLPSLISRRGGHLSRYSRFDSPRYSRW
jgi:hydroxyacyl-ACP dehydratase HTD2-like protein with hotdog domain